MSHLIEFYRASRPDAEGRYLPDLWNWDDEELETVHDFIQWMFPLAEPSRFNPDAPLLTDADVAIFRGDEALRRNLETSFERFLAFLGLERDANGSVVEGANFAGRVPDVWDYPNHNWLRITRVLHSLRLLGREDDAQALFDRLDAIHSSRRFPITEQTFRYWRDAAAAADESS